MRSLLVMLAFLVLLVPLSGSVAYGLPVNPSSIVCARVSGEYALFYVNNNIGIVTSLLVYDLSNGTAFTVSTGSDRTVIVGASPSSAGLLVSTLNLTTGILNIYYLNNITKEKINLNKYNNTKYIIKVYSNIGSITSASTSLDTYQMRILGLIAKPSENNKNTTITTLPVYIELSVENGKAKITKEYALNAGPNPILPPSSECTPFIISTTKTSIAITFVSGEGSPKTLYITVPEQPDPSTIAFQADPYHLVTAYNTVNDLRNLTVNLYKMSTGSTLSARIVLPDKILFAKPLEIAGLHGNKYIIEMLVAYGGEKLYTGFLTVDFDRKTFTLYIDNPSVPPNYIITGKGIILVDSSGRASLEPYPSNLSSLKGLARVDSGSFETSLLVSALSSTSTSQFKGITVSMKGSKTPQSSSGKTGGTHQEAPATSASSGGGENTVGSKRKLVAILLILIIITVIVLAIFVLVRKGKLQLKLPRRRGGEPESIEIEF